MNLKKLISPQILKFAIIGGGSAFSYVILSTLVLWQFPMWPKALVSAACYALFVFPVYLLQRNFTFQSDVAHKKALPRYVTIQVVSVVLNFISAKILYDFLHLPHFIIQCLVIVATSLASFVALKLWAFTHHEKN